MTEYDYYLTAVKEDGVSLFDVPYVYQTNELIMIALEVHRDRYVGSLVYRESEGSGSSRAREFHPHPLTEPCVKVSPHTALHTQFFVHRHNLGV